MRKDIKADLSLLNKLVTELSTQLDIAYDARDLMKASHSNEKYETFVIELSKSIGLLSGIANEASLLVGDLQKIMQYAPPTAISEEISDLLKTYKKGGLRN